MSEPWKGKLAVDIRDATPDWTPFVQPTAPENAPNILFIIWDDVGYSTMDVFGGPVETPTMHRIAEMGLRYSNFHTTALCSPTRVMLIDRAKRDQQQHGVHYRRDEWISGKQRAHTVREWDDR